MKLLTSFNTLLFSFTLFIFLMISFRYFYFGNRHFVFLTWNIFLAWIPYVISGLLPGFKTKWKQLLLGACWLLFFPNSLYIVTDLFHLREASSVPVWYDTILGFSAALAGLIMAFVSLYRVEKFLTGKINARLLIPSVMLILFLGSFGVYLGRYLRFNSWDIVRNPALLMEMIADRFLAPLDHTRTWGMTLLLTGMYSFLFFLIKKLAPFVQQNINAGS